MTARPQVVAQPDINQLPPLPDPPQRDMQQHMNFVLPGVASSLAQHLGALLPGSTTLVGGDGYLCPRRSDYPGCPHPDMIVAFGVDPASIVPSNGYVIEEVGKPPDLVLEVASRSTGRRDYIAKRGIYAGLGVPEYWRFDHSGGRYHDTALAGDSLSEDGKYQPITITTEPDGVLWGYSKKLELSVCWVAGRLRFWDRAQQRYLPNQPELTAALSESQARANAAETRANAAETRAASERQARTDAEIRIRLLEEELRRRQNP